MSNQKRLKKEKHATQLAEKDETLLEEIKRIKRLQKGLYGEYGEEDELGD